ncbi:hypothetical protein AMTRI_Chr03g144180 [Amborella trichopoda]
MHLCMKYFMYSCMLACCIYGCMCMLSVAFSVPLSQQRCSSVSPHVFHAVIFMQFGKILRLFSSISVCNRSKLFLFLQKIQEPFFVKRSFL